MIIGFVLIVSLLTIAINKNIVNSKNPDLNKKFSLPQNESLISITYASNYTILLITTEKNTKTLRIISNKTGKILSDTLLLDLLSEDSEK